MRIFHCSPTRAQTVLTETLPLNTSTVNEYVVCGKRRDVFEAYIQVYFTFNKERLPCLERERQTDRMMSLSVCVCLRVSVRHANLSPFPQNASFWILNGEFFWIWEEEIEFKKQRLLCTAEKNARNLTSRTPLATYAEVSTTSRVACESVALMASANQAATSAAEKWSQVPQMATWGRVQKRVHPHWPSCYSLTVLFSFIASCDL